METEYDERSPLLSSGTRAGGSPSSHSFFSAISRFCIKLYKLMEPLIQPHQSNMMIVLLVVATCSERLLFKVVANKMVPYRFVLVETMLLMSFLVHGTISLTRTHFSSASSEYLPPESDKEFPQQQLIQLSLLDLAQFSGLVLSASYVPPVMTAVLLHASTPTVLVLSRWLFPLRKYSTLQIRGALLIAWAVCMALLIALVTYSSILLHTNHEDSRSHIDPDSHKLVHPTTVIAQSTGLLIGSSTVPMLGHSVSPESASYTLSVLVSTVVYILFAAMHGLTTLMKEKVIIEYGEPVDIYQLSVWLFSYQAAFGFLFSPLIYFLQGVTVGLPLGFPVSAYLVNMRDGLGCLVGSRLSETQFDDFIVSTDDTSTAVTSLGGHSTLNTYTNVNTSSRHFDTSRRSLEDTGKATSSSQLYDMRGSVQCSEHTLIYIFLYVISTVAIIECMARLLQRQGGQPVPLSRVLLVTMLLSCIILGMYDILQGQCDGWFHSHFGLFDIAVVVVMFTGIELFSRESEPDIEIKTHVPFSTAP